ncbi:C-C motif chemokine 7 [Labeo rohita]|uniref:C-C motif chemokine 7 n=1 Tax=Labeo rohita TaxID=84645 RepID=A0ABQ8M485_LABRO|nr:C-C motif chemokine 7 [Labeo rohita]
MILPILLEQGDRSLINCLCTLYHAGLNTTTQKHGRHGQRHQPHSRLRAHRRKAKAHRNRQAIARESDRAKELEPDPSDQRREPATLHTTVDEAGEYEGMEESPAHCTIAGGQLPLDSEDFIDFDLDLHHPWSPPLASECRTPPRLVDPVAPPWLLAPSSLWWPVSPPALQGSLVLPSSPSLIINHPSPRDSTPLAASCPSVPQAPPFFQVHLGPLLLRLHSSLPDPASTVGQPPGVISPCSTMAPLSVSSTVGHLHGCALGPTWLLLLPPVFSLGPPFVFSTLAPSVPILGPPSVWSAVVPPGPSVAPPSIVTNLVVRLPSCLPFASALSPAQTPSLALCPSCLGMRLHLRGGGTHLRPQDITSFSHCAGVILIHSYSTLFNSLVTVVGFFAITLSPNIFNQWDRSMKKLQANWELLAVKELYVAEGGSDKHLNAPCHVSV